MRPPALPPGHCFCNPCLISVAYQMRKQASKPQNLREFLVTNLLQLPDAIVTLDFRLLVSLLLRGD